MYGLYINIIAKHRTLLASVYQSVLRSVPGVVASRYSGCWISVIKYCRAWIVLHVVHFPLQPTGICFNVVEQNTFSQDMVGIHPH